MIDLVPSSPIPILVLSDADMNTCLHPIEQELDITYQERYCYTSLRVQIVVVGMNQPANSFFINDQLVTDIEIGAATLKYYRLYRLSNCSCCMGYSIFVLEPR
ncbi:hypothetical protein AVEN_240606-1 [Araneus ventricosus]|uniref:Uncharacterized protein n=1 Tax=Araneus ventricosus TaxID=182803 RepID=A0A4Y2D657_ARAVE|nr:hypothetical protein AVEN_240606-1 [Araneus ventricosus]